MVAENINNEPINVKHRDLERWTDDSAFKSQCPSCKDGALFMYRDDKGLLTDKDRCPSCGQAFIYTDIEPGHYMLKYRQRADAAWN